MTKQLTMYHQSINIYEIDMCTISCLIQKEKDKEIYIKKKGKKTIT